MSQVLGSTLAAGTLRLIFNGHEDHFSGTLPSDSYLQTFVIEFIITFYLMFVVSGVATDNRAVSSSSLYDLTLNFTRILLILIINLCSLIFMYRLVNLLDLLLVLLFFSTLCLQGIIKFEYYFQSRRKLFWRYYRGILFYNKSS